MNQLQFDQKSISSSNESNHIIRNIKRPVNAFNHARRNRQNVGCHSLSIMIRYQLITVITSTSDLFHKLNNK